MEAINKNILKNFNFRGVFWLLSEETSEGVKISSLVFCFQGISFAL
jgi:hypothetical protein